MSNESVEIGRLWLQLKRIADAMVAPAREPFVNLPGLRGYWPMSIVDFLGNAKDHSAASSDLARAGAPQFGYDGSNAYAQCGVGNDYLQGSTSAQTITGLETWIEPTLRGLTLGGWFNIDSLPVSASGFITKDGGSPQRSYSLVLFSTGDASFNVSGNGLTVQSVNLATGSILVWRFIAARFTPSTEIAVFVDGTKVVNTTSIPASLFVSTQPFEIGRYLNQDARIAHIKIRDPFLCQAILTDAQIESLRLSSLPG